MYTYKMFAVLKLLCVLIDTAKFQCMYMQDFSLAAAEKLTQSFARL